MLANDIDFLVGVRGEAVERDHLRYAEVAEVLDMAREVFQPLGEGFGIGFFQILLGDTPPCIFKRTDGRHEHRRIGLQTRPYGT